MKYILKQNIIAVIKRGYEILHIIFRRRKTLIFSAVINYIKVTKGERVSETPLQIKFEAIIARIRFNYS